MAKPTALQKEVIRLVKNELDYLSASNDIDSPSHHTSITHEMLHNLDDWYDDGADEKYHDVVEAMTKLWVAIAELQPRKR